MVNGSKPTTEAEEGKTDIYPAATLENNNTPATDPLAVEMNYYTINTNNIVSRSAATGITDYQNHNGNPPTGNSSPIPPNNNPNCTATTPIKFTDLSNKLYKINGNDAKKTGLDITLKVMSGDKINILGKSYYFNSTVAPTSPNLPLNDIISALLGTPAGITNGKATAADLIANSSGFGNPVSPFLTKNNTSTPTGQVRAFINYILLDEQFNYVTAYASQVNTTAGTIKSHWDADPQLQNIPVTKNGYLDVYCSNESPVNVFFDNLQVTQQRSALLEETHYYPFGLTMAGISSKAAGKIINRYKFNGGNELQNAEFSDGSGLEAYDAINRMYDPQLGRFWQVDELAESHWECSPYVFGLNNPISLNDPLGLDPEKSTPDKPKDLDGAVVRSVSHNKMQAIYWQLRGRGQGFGVLNDRLRARLERWDNIQRFMDNIHAQTRKQDEFVLEVATWLIPAGQITKLRYLKYAGKLFNFKRGGTALIYGRSLLINTAKTYFANRGDISKMDGFDIATSTLNPFDKFGVGGKISTEFLKAAIDAKSSGFNTVFDGSKSSVHFGIDMIFGVTKVGVNDALGSAAGGDASREFVIDNISDQIKYETKNFVQTNMNKF